MRARSSALRVVMAVMLTMVVGCSSEIEATCERADECNVLRDQSAEECTEASEKRAEGLGDGEAADLDTMLDACLEWESCEAFRECLNDVNDFGVDRPPFD